jgi:hypothetical protein
MYKEEKVVLSYAIVCVSSQHRLRWYYWCSDD